MAKEIERKFLVKNLLFKEMAVREIRIKQGYLFDSPKGVVRIRIKQDTAFLTIKSANKGIVRDEWEYEIPVCDAEEMLRLAYPKVIEKIRYIVPFRGQTWEVDVFEGKHKGLILAEVELPSADTDFELPPFIGEEVSDNPAYYNSSLAASRGD